MGNSNNKNKDRSFYEPEEKEDGRNYISLYQPRLEYGFRGKCGNNSKIDINFFKNGELDWIDSKIKNDPLLEDYVKLINRALRKESSLCHDYYCFYSSTIYRSIYDAYKALYHMTTKKDINMNSFIFRPPNNMFKNIDEFLYLYKPENFLHPSTESIGTSKHIDETNFPEKLKTKFSTEVDEDEKDSWKMWDDHVNFVKKHVISCGNNLLGNKRDAGESALYWFYASRNVGKINELNVIKKIYSNYFSKDILDNIMIDFSEFYNKYYKNKNTLSQIMIKKEYISEIAYLSGPYGMPLCYPQNNSELLDASEESYYEILKKNMNQIYQHEHLKENLRLLQYSSKKEDLQARILYVPEFFESEKYQVFHYTLNYDEENYYYDFLSIVNKYAKYTKMPENQYSVI